MIKEARATFNKLWERKNFTWQYEKIEDNELDSIEHWTKECDLFKVYVSHYGDNVFDVAVHIGYDFGAGDMFSSDKLTSDAETMRRKADEIIQELIKSAIRSWMGFDLDLTRPPDEIRLKQITGSVDGRLFGLDENGIVYTNQGHTWKQLSMTKEG